MKGWPELGNHCLQTNKDQLGNQLLSRSSIVWLWTRCWSWGKKKKKAIYIAAEVLLYILPFLLPTAFLCPPQSLWQRLLPTVHLWQACLPSSHLHQNLHQPSVPGGSCRQLLSFFILSGAVPWQLQIAGVEGLNSCTHLQRHIPLLLFRRYVRKSWDANLKVKESAQRSTRCL